MTEFTPASLNRLDTARLAAYKTNLDFYNGSQWPTTSRHRQLVFNYAKVSIDKVTSFLMQGLAFACYPSAPLVSLRGAQRRGNLADEETRVRQAEQLLHQVYEENNLQQLDYETEVDAAVLGDGCYKVIWDTDEKRVRITAPDVSGIFAWWLGDDTSRVWRVASRYTLTQDEVQILYRTTIPKASAVMTELWTAQDFSLYLDNDIIESKPNPYGFIPFIIFPNFKKPKGYFASPGEGVLASLRFRAEVQLRLGYKTPAGAETLPNLTYWIDSWQYSSSPNESLFYLRCADLWGLASRWAARYSLRWNYTSFQPCRVWEVLYQFLGRLGIRLWNNPASPKSDAIDDYYPKFLSRGGTLADTQLRRLLSFVTDCLVPRFALCYAKDPLATESSCCDYENQPGSHPITAGAYADKLTTTHTQVSGDTQDEPPVHVREAAFDWDLLSMGIDNLRMQYDANLEETDQAAKRADALLRDSSLRAERGNLVIPTNVAQKLYDVITVTDLRCGIDQEKYRVLAIRTDYDRRTARYDQTFILGAP